MIGYVFLIIALFAGWIKGYCGKRSSSHIVTLHDAMLSNTARMAIALVIGFFIVVIKEGVSALAIGGSVLFIAFAGGAALSVNVVSWILAARRGAYVMIEVMMLFSVSIPLVYCMIVYGEPVSVIQWLGIALLFVATYIMTVYNSGINGKMKLLDFIILIICVFASGTFDLTQKIFVKSNTGVDISVFNFYVYVFAALIIAVALAFVLMRARKKEDYVSPVIAVKKVWPYVVIMALGIFVYSYFKTASAEYLDAAKIYPIFLGASLLGTTVMSAIFFGEKITIKSAVGMTLCAVSLIMINGF